MSLLRDLWGKIHQAFHPPVPDEPDLPDHSTHEWAPYKIVIHFESLDPDDLKTVRDAIHEVNPNGIWVCNRCKMMTSGQTRWNKTDTDPPDPHVLPTCNQNIVRDVLES